MIQPAVATKMTAKAASIALLKRIHFYIGLFVGPFIFIAALTGTLYVLTPQLENHLYADVLFTSSKGDVQPLSRQIEAALATREERAQIFAVRPAPAPGETTRVMLSDPELGASKSKAVFVDPVTLDIKGEETVYGTVVFCLFAPGWMNYIGNYCWAILAGITASWLLHGCG